jgi:hypothetical protein
MKRCVKCGQPWKGHSKVGYGETCDKCFAFIHACVQCKLYRPELAHHCQSETTESIRYVEGKNFCGEFRFADSGSAKTSAEDPSKKARDKFDSLFGE